MKKIYILSLIVISFLLFWCKNNDNPTINWNNNQTWQINNNWNQDTGKSKEQEIVESIAKIVWKTEWDVKSKDFEWVKKNFETVNLKGFYVFTDNSDPQMWDYFSNWNSDINNIADSMESSTMWYKKDNIVCKIYNNFKTESDIVKQISTEVFCWALNDESTNDNNSGEEFANTDEEDNMYKDYLNMDAFWEEPSWSLSLAWHDLSFESPSSKRRYSWHTQKEGNEYIYEWTWDSWNIKAIVKEEKCTDSSIWNTHKYKVSLIIDWNIKREWCWDKVDWLFGDPFFQFDKTWPISELKEKTNFDFEDDKDAKYTINYFDNRYLLVWITYPVWGHMLVLKNTSNWWVEVVWFQDTSDDVCETLNQENPNILEWDVFANCPKW